MLRILFLPFCLILGHRTSWQLGRIVQPDRTLTRCRRCGLLVELK